MSGFPKVEINEKGCKPTIVFIAGFPDDQLSPWGPDLRSKISADYHVIFLCLPGYDGKVTAWGYDFDVLVDLLHFTISQSTSRDEKVYLVGHDWGAFFASNYQSKYPHLVHKLVMLDIGMLTISSVTKKQLLLGAFYQLWFAIAFLLSQFIHQTIGYYFFLAFGLPFIRPFWAQPDLDRYFRLDQRVADRCYPYYHLWKRLLTRTMVYPTFPTCPLLFLYGTEKKFMFHDQEFLHTISQRKDCKAVAMKTGHWMALEDEEGVYQELKKFLEL